MSTPLLLINGPNLNLLGTREPHVYGTESLADIEQAAQTQGQSLDLSVSAFQSNHEGQIVDRVHAARLEGVKFIVINPGAYAHTSIAIRDALSGVAIPFVEVHISNVHGREEFRHRSFLNDKAVGVVCGLGTYGYTAAIEFAARYLDKSG